MPTNTAMHSSQGPRDNYEDACMALTISPPGEAGQATVMVVADGVGGGPGGEVASRTAVNVFSGYVTTRFMMIDTRSRARVDWGRRIRRILQAAMLYANRAIVTQAAREPHLAGMATSASRRTATWSSIRTNTPPVPMPGSR